MYGFPMGMDHRLGTRATPLKDYDPERYEPLFHPGDQGSFTIFHDAARVVGADRSASVDPMARAARRACRRGRRLAVGDAAGRVLQRPPRDRPDRRRVRARRVGGQGTALRGRIDALRHDDPRPRRHPDADDRRQQRVRGRPARQYRRGRHRRRSASGRWRERRTRPSPISTDDGGWTSNPLVLAPLHEAALRAIQRWLTEGTAPRHQPRIEVEPGRPARIPRDELGNAFGGIRLPELAAPLREYRGHRVRHRPPTAHGIVTRVRARRRPPSLSVPRRLREPSGARQSTISKRAAYCAPKTSSR